MAGRRYNKGKLRYELISDIGLEKVAEVYTKGAEKYTLYNEDGTIQADGANNWKNGLSWMDTIGAVERHIKSWKKGENNDKELNTKHLANAAWGLLALLDFEETKPEFDDRTRMSIQGKRISLDIDDVLAGWIDSFCKIHDIDKPTSWQFHRNLSDVFNKMKEDGIDLDEWMSNLPLITKPEDLSFEPVAYITARAHCDISCAEKWLDKHKFPAAPVYQTNGKSKIDICKELNIDIHIDDNYTTFLELNRAGITCYLFDSCHNQRYNVGSKRIYNLKELI